MQLGLNLGFSPSRKGSGSGGSGLQGIKFWTFTRDVAGLAANLFTIFTNGLRIDWGDGASATPATNTNVTRTLGRSGGITLYPTGLITHINTQTSTSSVLGGNVNVENLPNLIQLTITSSGISSISGYEKNTNLQILNISNNVNSTTLTLPSSLEAMTSLRTFECASSNVSGTFPSLTGLIALVSVRVGNNFFSESMPELQGLTALVDFLAANNQFTGSMPTLANLSLLQNFECSQNNLTGEISSTGGMSALRTFLCDQNQLSGTIPSLAGRSQLTTFSCHTNQLTGQGGSSLPIALGNYRAENNLFSTAEVNKILSMLVVANRTTGTRILNLGGTGNAAPTGQGLTDKATLISRGWTVTTN
jgi:hypothetical protein